MGSHKGTGAVAAFGYFQVSIMFRGSQHPLTEEFGFVVGFKLFRIRGSSMVPKKASTSGISFQRSWRYRSLRQPVTYTLSSWPRRLRSTCSRMVCTLSSFALSIKPQVFTTTILWSDFCFHAPPAISLARSCPLSTCCPPCSCCNRG